MDRASEKERSSKKSRDERERDRGDSGRSHHRVADRDRDRDREHDKHRHLRDERRHGDDPDDARDSGSRRSRDGDRHHHRSGRDSPQDADHRRERSQSNERARDSVERARVSREKSVERRSSRKRKEHRGGDEDESDLRHERSRSHERARNSVERGRVSREESVERRPSRKRKEHGGGNEDVLDKAEKRSRVADVKMEEKRERRRFEDRADVMTEEKRERIRFEDSIAEDLRDLNGGHTDSVKEEEAGDAEERMETRKIKDKVKEEPFSDGEERRGDQKSNGWIKVDEMNGGEEAAVVDKKEKRRERRFDDKVKGEEVGFAEEGKIPASALNLEKKAVIEKSDDDQRTMALGKSDSGTGIVGLEPLTVGPTVVLKTTMASNNSLPTKVSSITTTNENEGVNVTRSDEVPGKFSTDGATTSVAGKSGSLSLDALAKAKKALQMQKELSEKMKKIPMLNKLPSSSADSNAQVVGLKREGPNVLPSTAGQHGPSAPTVASSASSQPTSGLSTLPATAASSVKPSAAGGMAVPLPGLTAIPNIEAVKRAQELAAKMGFHHDPEFAPLINMFPGPTTEVTVPQRPSKAPVLRLDAQGREVDEHGNVINMPKLTNLSTLKVNINKQKKEAFQILRPELDANAESNPHFDASMGINKTKLLRPKRMTFQFVEEGKWSKQAEIIKFKSQFGEAQAKELKTKQAQLAKAKAEPDINPNLIEVSERVVKEKQRDPIPETEWWDLPILLSATYGDVAKDKLNMEKITIYVEHPLPIDPPAEPAPPPPQPLKLTKKEQKKLRTQRRLAKERDRQEMIRQGLIEPPRPKIKMSNVMKVLGSEATQDPTRLEMEIRSAAAEREQAHVDRNIARKLTPAERREKKERKLFEDSNTLETIVSVYKVNYLSHPKTRFQVDVNAQENRMTGCVVISEGICVVVVEGGKKSNKRYRNLMLKRIDWAAAITEEEEGDESLDTPVNKCVLVWQGSVAKPSFNRFLIHQCRTEAAARKVLADAGVAHYWDLSVNFSDEVI